MDIYKQEIGTFGKYQKYRFYNESSGHSFSIVPGRGACILECILGAKEVMNAYKDEAALEAHIRYKNELLFPFPNRLKNGHYTFYNKQYQFEINNPSTGNALHGIGIHQPFELMDVQLEVNKALVKCSYKDHGKYPAYPFPYVLEVTYKMDNDHSFAIELSFQNTGIQSIPVGLGWHPYFQLDGLVNDWELQLPNCELVEVDEYMIPTGRTFPYTYFDESKKIGLVVLDNCFKIRNEDQRAFKVQLKNQNLHLEYWQQTGLQKFNFIQLYTLPNRQAIAIEPMTCNINAFNNKDGLILLSPEEKISAKAGIRLIEKS